MNIYNKILTASKVGKKLFSVLIDPDKFNPVVVEQCEKIGVDFIMVGGSIITNGNFESCIKSIKSLTSIPVIIFPGNSLQVSAQADAMLFLSLISGRNAEMLIGNHVLAAPIIQRLNLEAISTGYMLIDAGIQTSVSYMSNTMPIPYDKTEIAVATALAGELLGLKQIYLDAGSGAANCVSAAMVAGIKENVNLPVIVGGGVNSKEKVFDLCAAGADMIVVGNPIEKDPSVISIMSECIHSFNN